MAVEGTKNLSAVVSSAGETRRPRPDEATRRELAWLPGQLDELPARLDAAEPPCSQWLAAVDPEYRGNARNLLHYWAIRQCDLRELQVRPAAFGLSWPGRSESHVPAAHARAVTRARPVVGRIGGHRRKENLIHE